jgi:hypothetical protein
VRPLTGRRPARLSDLSALGGTRTPNLLIRRYLNDCPGPFGSVRDLGFICSERSGSSRHGGKSFVRVAPRLAPGAGVS